MKSLVSFLREVKVELFKVIWPRKEEFVGAVFVVLLTLVVFAFFFTVVNTVFQTGALKGFRYFTIGY